MTSTHVLISAMVPGSLPLSLSLLSDLWEKMTLRLVYYPKQEVCGELSRGVVDKY